MEHSFEELLKRLTHESRTLHLLRVQLRSNPDGAQEDQRAKIDHEDLFILD